MAWQTARFQWTSSAPFIMHNGQTADPTNRWAKAMKKVTGKRVKTDADYEEMARIEFLAGLYMGTSGPIIPSMLIDSVMINAAKKQKSGMQAKSGLFCPSHALLTYEGPRTVEELWADEAFRFSALVRVGMARVARMRPIFNEWSCVVELSYEETLVNVAQLEEWSFIAGTQVGVGDWRPKFGRFQSKIL